MTYKCLNKYKTIKCNTIKYYCIVTIKAIRNKDNNTKFTYYFTEKNSEICLEEYNKLLYIKNTLNCDHNLILQYDVLLSLKNIYMIGYK